MFEVVLSILKLQLVGLLLKAQLQPNAILKNMANVQFNQEPTVVSSSFTLIQMTIQNSLRNKILTVEVISENITGESTKGFPILCFIVWQT